MLTRILRLGGINPLEDFLGVLESVVPMAPGRGQAYYRILTKEGRGWQRASHVSAHPHAQYYHGGHGTTDAGLVGILQTRRLQAFQYAGVYGFVTKDAEHPVWGADSLRQVMEKVAMDPKNWAGVLIEVRCRAHCELVPGGVFYDCEAVHARGCIAHASKSNGGRYLLPVPFLDLVGLWVPLYSYCGDTLPGCLTHIPGVAGSAALLA